MSEGSSAALQRSAPQVIPIEGYTGTGHARLLSYDRVAVTYTVQQDIQHLVHHIKVLNPTGSLYWSWSSGVRHRLWTNLDFVESRLGGDRVFVILDNCELTVWKFGPRKTPIAKVQITEISPYKLVALPGHKLAVMGRNCFPFLTARLMSEIYDLSSAECQLIKRTKSTCHLVSDFEVALPWGNSILLGARGRHRESRHTIVINNIEKGIWRCVVCCCSCVTALLKIDQSVVSGHFNGKIRTYTGSPLSLKIESSTRVNSSSITCLVDLGKRRIASGHSNGMILIWQGSNLHYTAIKFFVCQSAPVSHLVCLTPGGVFASASGTSQLSLERIFSELFTEPLEWKPKVELWHVHSSRPENLAAHDMELCPTLFSRSLSGKLICHVGPNLVVLGNAGEYDDSDLDIAESDEFALREY